MMNHKMASFSKPLNTDIHLLFKRRSRLLAAGIGVAAVAAIAAEQQQEDQNEEQNRAIVAEQISAESHRITSYHFILCRWGVFGAEKV